ncbi:MAG: tRNA epoxyqueuosine(34) reductase QueG [Peptostreptococcaceae bacterium]|jgi:epoxyqueuosine reductase|nr:tRNA epoxyqueuosine(34) reductase QueG [Peptostreptococcaceae bacterium]
MKEDLKKIANEMGFEIGIIKPKIFGDLADILIYRKNKNLENEFEKKEFEEKINPFLTMEDCMSIIVGIFPYYSKALNGGNLSNYCKVADYHSVVKNLFIDYIDKIKTKYLDFDYKIFTDNGPLIDRYLAYKAGLGFFGLNNSLINDDYGSYIFIGYMLTSLELEEDYPLNKECFKCKKCIKYCPGNALKEKYDSNYDICASYITQKKGELKEVEKQIINKSKKIFGCDVCQEICFHNRNIKETRIREFKENIKINLQEDELINLSNKEYKRKYKDRAFSWRSKKILLRNIELIKN